MKTLAQRAVERQIPDLELTFQLIFGLSLIDPYKSSLIF